MILLGINTCTPKQWIKLFLDGKIRNGAVKTWNGRYDETEKVLPSIVQVLKKKKIDFNDLDGILVLRGPGGFSSVRIGVTIANTLAFVLKIPVFALTVSEFSGNFYKRLKAAKTAIAAPLYDKAPNITLKKS